MTEGTPGAGRGGAGAHFDDKCNLDSWTEQSTQTGRRRWVVQLGWGYLDLNVSTSCPPRHCAKFPSDRSEWD